MGLEHLQTVYSYGGGEALFSVFSAVSSFFTNYGGSVFKGLAMFGLLWAGFKSAANRDHYKFYIKWFLTYMTVMIVLWQPGTTGMSMHIRDVITKETFNVTHLPPGLVIPAGFISGIGHGMTEAFESVFRSVNDLPYEKYGTVFGAQVASELRNFKIQDPVFRENMESYVSNCMAYDVMIGQTYDITTLKTSPDVFNLIKDKASRFRMVDYRFPNAGGRDLITCYDAIVKLGAEFEKEHTILGLKFPNFSRIAFNATQGWFGSRGSKVAEPWRQNAGQMFVSALQTGLGFYGNTENGQLALRQILMINAFKDKPASYGSMRALQNQNTAWRFTGELSRIVLPVMHATFECLVYGCFPIIIGFLFFTGAFRLLGSYFGILIWLQLWPLLFSILNLVISVFSRRAGLGEELTINNISNIVDTQTSYAMAASSLGMLVPVLSYMIVRGGAGQFVHIASQLAGASSQGVSVATGEVTSGNRNLDNVSMGNMSLDNTSSYKYNIAPDFQGMHSRHELSDGTQKTDFIYGDKDSIMQSGPGLTQSSGPLNIGLARELQQSTQKSYSEQQQHHEQESFAFEESQRATESHAVNFVSNLAENMNRGESYNFDTSTSEGRAFEETLNRARDLHENHGYGWTQEKLASLSAMLSGSAGASTSAFGPSLGADFKGGVDIKGSASNTGTQSYGDQVSVSEKDNLNHSLDNIYKASKSMTFGETQSQEKTLIDSFTQSYETTQSKSHSLRESKDTMQALEERKNFAESLNFRNDINLYDEAFRYVENLPDPVYKGYKLEQFQAQKIMNDMSPEGIQKRERLLEGFYERYMPESHVPKTLNQSNETLKKSYTSHSVKDTTDDFKFKVQGEEFQKIKQDGPFAKTHEDAKESFHERFGKANKGYRDARMRQEDLEHHLKSKIVAEEKDKGFMTNILGLGRDNKNNDLWDKRKK